MNYRILTVFVIAMAARGADTSAAKGCDRACLQGFVDSYLDAMAKHDPSKLPVAASVKFTENGKALIDDEAQRLSDLADNIVALIRRAKTCDPLHSHSATAPCL